MIRRIQIFGGPGSGKSTTMAWLFSQLKIAGHDIQFMEEYVKRWAYLKRPIISFDQMYITSSQITLEDELLRNGVRYIISDCPSILTYIFAKRNKLPYAQLTLDLCRQVEAVYPSVNIYLNRDVSYVTQGRYESEEEAKWLDKEILEFLKSEYNELIISSPKEKERLLRILNDTLR